MILFPAIDLKDGHCVRLRQGEMAEATVFNTDPAAQARTFEEQGFVWRLVMTQHLKTGIGVAMLVFPLCGYLFGRYLWTTGEENYERMVESKDVNGKSPPRRHR